MTEQTEADFEQLLGKFESFAADRKLIIARSPFDYWSRRIEQRLKITGMAFAFQSSSSREASAGASFQIVDQIINTDEALVLHQELSRLSRAGHADRAVLNELRFTLRRLLVGLNPVPKDDDNSFSLEIQSLLGLARSLGVSESSSAWKVLLEIEKRLKAGDFVTKLKRLEEMGREEKIEIWVTKDDDKNILSDSKQRNGLNVEIRIANRWLAPGVRAPQRKVVLSRIDRMVDLNLVPYLQTGDVIIMSAWEAIIRRGTTMTAWEQSEKWREASKTKGVVPVNATFADPILDLASYVDKTNSVHLAINSQPVTSDTSPSDGDDSWWDRNDTGSILETQLSRDQLVVTKGSTTYPCREIFFEGGWGMFARRDSNLQVISDDEDEGDIISVPVPKLKVGTTVVLFKDSERSSMFDILMDQLERSEEYRDDAKVVRSWKQLLRSYAISRDLDVLDLTVQLDKSGGNFDPLTVRSWIYGSTMAPMKFETLQLLVNVLQLRDVDAPKVFASVQKLRVIAQQLGRTLNNLIIHKNLEEVPTHVRNTIVRAGVDVDEISAAVETRVVTGVSDSFTQIDAAHTGKLYRLI
jgi:hypothetical protein